MRVVTIDKNKRHLVTDEFDAQQLSLLPMEQRLLLINWLKVKAGKPKWDTLLKIALQQGGQLQVDIAEALAQSLVACGAAILEQRRQGATWQNNVLAWSDIEAVSLALGVETTAVRRTAFEAEWKVARFNQWQRSALADAYQRLPELPPQRASARLLLLTKLNSWLEAGKTGSRYEFSLFSFGQTKHEISTAEWSWLEECISLEECGIERHAPALWLAGDIQLKIGTRWLDVGAAGDAVAFTPMTLANLNAAQSKAVRYRLVENRTSFERLAKTALSVSDDIVLWLPGYAPTWWRIAVGRLIDACPLPAAISCDADPDGVQIAIQVATLWSARDLSWQPAAMSAADASKSRHKLKMSERDLDLAKRILSAPGIPEPLLELLQWCITHQLKAEQENWIGNEGQ